MSSQLAAENGTDGAYLNALAKRARKFGFSEEQIKQFKHPRVVFRPDDEIPYTVDSFAEFNAQDKKGQDEEGVSAKAAQALKDEQKSVIANTIKAAGGMKAFLNNSNSMKKVFDTFAEGNVISRNDMAKYMNMESGKAEEKGKNLINNIVSGLVLGVDNVEGLNRSGMSEIKGKINSLAGEIAMIDTLPENYSIKSDMRDAVGALIKLATERKSYPNIEAYREKHPETGKLALYIADKIYNPETDENGNELDAFSADRLNDFIESLADEQNSFMPREKQEMIDNFIQKARRRGFARKVIKAWVRVWRIYEGLRKASARKVRKADDHKYIKREGSPGNYTYYYAEGAGQNTPAQENGGGDSKYESDKKKPPVDILNKDELKNFIDRALNTKENARAKVGIISKETRGKIKEICGEDVSHIEVDMAHVRHALNKPAHNLESSDILLSEEAINNAQEIKLGDELNHGSRVLEFKADIGGKIYFIESIHKKGDGFLSLITCYRQKKARRGSTEIQKRVSRSIRPERCASCLRKSPDAVKRPPRAHVQDAIPPLDLLSSESAKESSGEIKKTREAVLKSLLRTLRIWKRKREGSGRGRLERKAGARQAV
jgi:hypothetical protein